MSPLVYAILSEMRFLPLFWLAAILQAQPYPSERFTDPQRIQKLQAAMPQVDEIFQRFAVKSKIRGLVWGVVIDDKLAHTGKFGDKIESDTVFRIASMTKSFTALAILKLRDEGKLSLDDQVSKWIPEFAKMQLPTRDTAPLRIRNLMSHNAGFPEDNPWGDQQLAATDADVTKWLQAGIPFSTAPGTRYEYSNYAFGILGRIVAKASGMPYEKYAKTQILDKIGMPGSTFEFSAVPAAKRATGYRLTPEGTYQEEAPLPHGAFGSMGGLLTNAADLGQYVAFQLAAWPPRDNAEVGPVSRASVREMNQLWRPANLTVRRPDGVLQATASGYGYGLRISSDCRFEHISAHGGGLPGFGSYMLWLPDYGVGLFAMANLTYAGPAAPINEALDIFLKTGGLQRRELPPSDVLKQAREVVFGLWKNWDDAAANKIAAMNLFLDAPIPQRRAEIEKLKSEVGVCGTASPVLAENWLRGQFNLSCEKGTVGVFVTMAPTKPPTIQHLAFQKIANEKVRLGAPTGAPAGVSCRE